MKKTSATLHGNAPAQNETSATLHGNAFRRDWSPNMGPPKMAQTMYFKMFWNLFGAPPEHPSCAHQEMDQCKWTLKSAQGDRAKHSFSNLFLQFVFFGLHLVAAPGMAFILKNAIPHISGWVFQCLCTKAVCMVSNENAFTLQQT